MKPLTLLKRIWLGIITLFVVAYVGQHKTDFSQLLHSLPLLRLSLSAALIVLTKCLLTYNQALAAPSKLTYFENFYIYHTTQMSKYIPGVVWQYLGKAGEYLARGSSRATIHQPLVREILSLIVGSSLAATVYFLLSYLAVPPMYVFGFLSLALLSSIGMNTVFPLIRLVFLQLLIWGLWGVSLYVLLPLVSRVDYNVFYQVLSASSLSFLAGYLAVFAPSGIGVREAVFATILSSSIDQNLLILAGLHRLIYFTVEVGFFVVALALKRRYKI